MAHRRYNLVVILILLIALLASCNPDVGSGSSGTSNTSTYRNTVSVSVDGENLYPDAYDEDDYTSWKTYDFGTEYVFNVSTKEWVGASPADAGVAKVTLKDNSLKVTNKTDSAVRIVSVHDS